MKALYRFLVGLAIISIGFTHPARADDAATAYIVTY